MGTAAAQNPERLLEEVVVEGVQECGSWPIEHEDIRGCEFAELNREAKSDIKAARHKLFPHCLKCEDRTCSVVELPDDWKTEKRLCKRTFLTPSKVERFTRVDDPLGPMTVSFTFTISLRGRVRDIAVTSLEGEISLQDAMKLLNDGAARVRYRPVVVEGTRYEIIGVKDKFILGGEY